MKSEAYIGLKEDNMETGGQDLQLEEGSSINLNTLKILTKNNKLVLQNLISLTIESFNDYKEQYKKLIFEKNQKEVGLLTHKLKLSSNILCAERLEEVVKEARTLLAEGVEDEKLLQKAIDNIHKEFDNCIKELELEKFKI